MSDKKFRPEIVKADVDMSAYDTVIFSCRITAEATTVITGIA